ncbi:hypothetical protein AAG906_016393 [Vitis piasezkii]
MEQFFKATHIPDGEKVSITSMNLTGDAKLWWRTRMEDDADVEKARHIGSVRDYIKEFSSLMLDIKNMSEEDKLFNFMSGLQGWAQTELRRQGVHPSQKETRRLRLRARLLRSLGGRNRTRREKLSALVTVDDKGESDSKTPPRVNPLQLLNVINGLGGVVPLTTVATKEATRLGLKLEEGTSRIKAVNSKAQKIQGIAKNMALIPHLGGLMVLEEKQPCFVQALRAKDGGKGQPEMLSAIQLKRGQETYVAALIKIKEGQSMEVPDSVVKILKEFKDTLTEHEKHLRLVFQRLGENRLYVKPEKCEFAQEEITFLGHKISVGLISMDKGNVHAIMEWPIPSKVTKLRSFLGLANYYRRFIKRYSKMVSPLTDLMQCQMAFEGLKEAISIEPMLRLPNLDLPFEVQTDASDRALGGVLM